jgi:hypothetical protein
VCAHMNCLVTEATTCTVWMVQISRGASEESWFKTAVNVSEQYYNPACCF